MKKLLLLSLKISVSEHISLDHPKIHLKFAALDLPERGSFTLPEQFKFLENDFNIMDVFSKSKAKKSEGLLEQAKKFTCNSRDLKCCEGKDKDCFAEGGCFCDEDCQKHGDCCPDYGNTCHFQDKRCLGLEVKKKKKLKKPPRAFKKIEGDYVSTHRLPEFELISNPDYVEADGCCNGERSWTEKNCCCVIGVSDVDVSLRVLLNSDGKSCDEVC